MVNGLQKSGVGKLYTRRLKTNPNLGGPAGFTGRFDPRKWVWMSLWDGWLGLLVLDFLVGFVPPHEAKSGQGLVQESG